MELLLAIICLGVAFIFDYVLWYWFRLNPLLSWLVAINLVAVMIYSYERAMADKTVPPVPVWLLLLVSIIGGWTGALLIIWLYRHRPAWEHFRRNIWWIVSGNVLIVLLYIWLF